MFVWTISDAIGVILALLIGTIFGIICIQDWLAKRRRAKASRTDQ